jgi:hypothetical protein
MLGCLGVMVVVNGTFVREQPYTLTQTYRALRGFGTIYLFTYINYQVVLGVSEKCSRRNEIVLPMPYPGLLNPLGEKEWIA